MGAGTAARVSLKDRLRWLLLRKYASQWFLVPGLDDTRRQEYTRTGDPVRYAAFDLAFDQIRTNGIPGAIAECGVYKGTLSAFLHQRMPDRELYLFDTFEGFDTRDPDAAGDDRFRDTSAESVLRTIGSSANIFVRKGYFPETAAGLEQKRFSCVVLDFDKYEPTRAALAFFYPRTERGGFIFVHDYSSTESDHACSRALDEFLRERPERPVLLPDSWGTAVIRKT